MQCQREHGHFVEFTHTLNSNTPRTDPTEEKRPLLPPQARCCCGWGGRSQLPAPPSARQVSRLHRLDWIEQAPQSEDHSPMGRIYLRSVHLLRVPRVVFTRSCTRFLREQLGAEGSWAQLSSSLCTRTRVSAADSTNKIVLERRLTLRRQLERTRTKNSWKHIASTRRKLRSTSNSGL